MKHRVTNRTAGPVTLALESGSVTLAKAGAQGDSADVQIKPHHAARLSARGAVSFESIPEPPKPAPIQRTSSYASSTRRQSRSATDLNIHKENS